ncbi:hypothetical protein BCD67_05155 [Oscillatoriales cyanobacterium USR001]|nr:hypothetical protein BCD67_05155 [Oscillatoriales cyanobacterium USR001]
MSNRDGFAGGFIAGAAIGGFVGALLGVILVRRSENLNSEISETKASKGKNHQIETERIEMARLGLEDKIAQLNQAIDDVRLQLGSVNGNAVHRDEASLAEDQ